MVQNLVNISDFLGDSANYVISLCVLGMGLAEFSVHPNALLEVKHIIVHSTLKNLQDEVKEIMQIHDIEEIKSRVQQLVNLL